MFYHRCFLIKQINTTISEQDATTDNLLTNATSSSVIILSYVYRMLTAINLCISCVLTTFNDDDDDDVCPPVGGGNTPSFSSSSPPLPSLLSLSLLLPPSSLPFPFPSPPLWLRLGSLGKHLNSAGRQTHLDAVFSERELLFTFAICRRPSVCRLSVWNVRTPYSADWNFRQCFCAI